MFGGQTSPKGLSVSWASWNISKFYRRHYILISKFNGGLKTLLRGVLSEPEFMLTWLRMSVAGGKEIFFFSFNTNI